MNEAAEVVTGRADANANIIFGAVIDESLDDELRVTVIATGFGAGRRRREPTRRVARTAGSKRRASPTSSRHPAVVKDDAASLGSSRIRDRSPSRRRLRGLRRD